MCEGNKNGVEISLWSSSGQPEIEAEHEASNDVDGYCADGEYKRISTSACILCLHLNCLDIDLLSTILHYNFNFLF